MQDNEKKPALRFKGFTDPWEQRKLAELTKTITTGKSVNSDEGEVSDGNIGVLKTSCVSYDRFNPSESKPVVKSEQQLVKCAVEKDSVIVSRMNTPERVGACGYVSTDFPNLFLPDRLWKLKFQDTVDTYFVYMMLVSSAYKEKITSMASGTSGSMYNIPKETFLNLQLVIPAKIDEQKQLGKILKKIDTLITLHQRKYEKLVNIKKSMLDKMFPKNGASVPEIRFKGFTDPWEQRKLGDVADIVGGGTPSTNNPNYWDGDIDWYAPAEIAGQIYFDSSQRKITEQGYENSSAKMLPPGTVLFTSRAGIGKTAILSKKGCTNQGFQSIVPHNDELDSYFVFSRTDELKQYGELVGAGSTFVEVSGKQMAAMNLKMPTTIEEQQTIGRFFKRLDTLITLHQRKLEKLQNIKKSCLEKMFV